jgi:hypothetical protein
MSSTVLSHAFPGSRKSGPSRVYEIFTSSLDALHFPHTGRVKIHTLTITDQTLAKAGFSNISKPQKTEKPDAMDEAQKYINVTVAQLFYTSNLVHDLYYRSVGSAQIPLY